MSAFFVFKGPCRILLTGLFLPVCVVLFTGCVATGKPQLHVANYLLEYPAPVFENPARIDDTVKVNRFTIATAYNSTNMIFRPHDYAVDSFNYNRWAVNPADMVGDNLLRDLKSGGLFRAAFSRYAVDEGRYIVQGGIEEFFLKLDKDAKTAVLSLDITLQDIKQREATKRFLFQKKYRQEEALAEQSPGGYCRAMSRAMQKLSRQIIDDIYQAAKAAEK